MPIYPGGPASQYYSRLIENKLRRVGDGLLTELTEQDCLEQQALLPQVLYEELEDTQFAVDHGDLQPQNIIVDSNYNIRGYVHYKSTCGQSIPN